MRVRAKIPCAVLEHLSIHKRHQQGDSKTKNTRRASTRRHLVQGNHSMQSGESSMWRGQIMSRNVQTNRSAQYKQTTAHRTGRIADVERTDRVMNNITRRKVRAEVCCAVRSHFAHPQRYKQSDSTTKAQCILLQAY